jgi:muramoyltetrapeptide carboxypeptidase LdcA involved in peptidoglycan recycling
VAIVSPSAGLAQVFPKPLELGLRRLREDFGLVPVVYPVTRVMGASAAARAADLHAAFGDPQIKAVIATIGGDDQITVLRHLDPELLRASPKPFFGMSDNTCLLAYLYELGITGYHGGHVMMSFGRSGAMHPVTRASLRAALFTSGEYQLAPVTCYGDVDVPWDDPSFGNAEPPMQPCEAWTWHNATEVVHGVSWGGNLEIVAWLLMAGRVPGPDARFDGGVLMLETSEEMPSATEVYRLLRCMGERGLLARFPAALIGRARAWSLQRRSAPEEKAKYGAAQRDAVLRAFGEYAPDAMVVFDVDFGHTEPQVVMPYGGWIRVDGPARRITVTY